MAVMVGTAGTDEAGEREGVERVVLEEGESALDIRADWVGSVWSEGGEVNVGVVSRKTHRLDQLRLSEIIKTVFCVLSYLSEGDVSGQLDDCDIIL